jgi:hypothetical protein
MVRLDRAKHNTYIHVIKLNDMIILKLLGVLIGVLAISTVLTFIIALLTIIIDDKLNN